MNRTAPDTILVDSVEALHDLIDNVSTNQVVILDCHEDWCGPTTQAMTPSYMQMYNEFQDTENRIKIATVAYNPEVNAILSKLSSEIKLGEQGCRPLFLLLRNNACVGVIDGLNTPNLMAAVRLWIPPLVVEEEDP